MARSVRHKPFFRVCSGSDKVDKTFAHRRTRAAAKNAIRLGVDAPDYRLTEDPWRYASDGKLYRPSDDMMTLRK
jgi:hypothetical protein